MKPSWEQAPEWANWMAMDKKQDWCWYRTRPIIQKNIWGTNDLFDYCVDSSINWKQTLQQRPEK